MDVTYTDPEQNATNANDKLDYKFILMRQIDKVRLSRSTEMRGGYWEKRPIAMGGGYTETQVYIPDTQETYTASVKALRCLMIVYFDEEFTKNYNDLLDKIEKIDEEDTDIKRLILVDIFDLILEELLMLCLRKKLIGGNQLLTDELDSQVPEVPEEEVKPEDGKNKS